MPLLASGILACFAATPSARESVGLRAAILFSAAGLGFATGLLWVFAAKTTLRARFAIRPAHVIQPLCHGAVYVYWAIFWPPVRGYAPLLAAQLAFAYAFDMLLAWTSGDEYELGFGPFPIIFSTNLFLWFRPDWFAWQFAMIAVAFGAKRLVRWQRDGHRVHVFNPSSLPLFLSSVFLLLFGGGSQLTLGNDIANSMGGLPHMHIYLFLISLPVQLYFGVALMTLSALASCFLTCQLYCWITGVSLFIGPIAPAVLLGMLLLFTDPSTSPRHESGRVIFGTLYGVGVAGTYVALTAMGQPGFYDKLLVVPFLNLMVRGIDRFTHHPRLAPYHPSQILAQLRGKPRNAAFIGVWALVFCSVFALRGLGESNSASRLPYWTDACRKNLKFACYNVLRIEDSLCGRRAGWACNEYAVAMLRAGQSNSAAEGITSLRRGCDLGYPLSCTNLRLAAGGPEALQTQPPGPQEFTPLIDNVGLPERRTVLQELRWACAQGWPSACETLSSNHIPLPASE